MSDYIQTEQECLEKCKGLVCLRCGTPLTPIETVDNSRHPTFWAGCIPCSIFSCGTSPEIFYQAKGIREDYRHISMDDLCHIIGKVTDEITHNER